MRVTPATGTGTVILSDDGNSARVIIELRSIENVVAAHIHRAAPGVNGPIIADLFGAPAPGMDFGPGGGILVDRTITAANLSGPFAPAVNPLGFQAFLSAFATGNLYFNVHTNDGVAPTNTGPGDFPGGEIRGNLFLPEPSTVTLFVVAGVTGLIASRRRWRKTQGV